MLGDKDLKEWAEENSGLVSNISYLLRGKYLGNNTDEESILLVEILEQIKAWEHCNYLSSNT